MKSLLMPVLLAALTAPAAHPRAQAAPATPHAPAVYAVAFRTTSGSFTIEVHRDWAPRGADRFYALVQSGYFTGDAFFRVVPGFVVQWGLNPDPKQSAVWEHAPLPDDPVLQSNSPGMVSFAASGPHSRTAQIFVNLGQNARLDRLGFAPFGRVTSGLNVVAHVDSEYGERPDQKQILAHGAAYLTHNFPGLDVIYAATLLPAAPSYHP